MFQAPRIEPREHANLSGRGWALVLGAVLSLASLQSAAVRAAGSDSLLAAHRGAIVQLKVQGKIDNKIAFEYGTGFLIKTSSGPRCRQMAPMSQSQVGQVGGGLDPEQLPRQRGFWICNPLKLFCRGITRDPIAGLR